MSSEVTASQSPIIRHLGNSKFQGVTSNDINLCADHSIEEAKKKTECTDCIDMMKL